MIIALDPERARDEYEKAVTQRAVVGHLKADGTAVVAGNGLAPEEAAATERIAHLASAVKRAGHPGLIDHIRADVCIRLLDGRFEQLTRQQMITALLADAGHANTDTDTTADSVTVNPAGDTATRDTTVGRMPGVEIRARSDTVIGLNELPGELPGRGSIIAPIVRRLVARQHRAAWRWAVTGPDGRP